MAGRILNDLYWGEYSPRMYLQSFQGDGRSPGKLDYRVGWLLLVLEQHANRMGPRELDFLIAVARDLGLWPEPKWWRVVRRMGHTMKFLTPRSV